MARLYGIYKFMMTVTAKTMGKRLAAKADRTAEEDRMPELLLHGGSCVREEQLKDVLAWYESI